MFKFPERADLWVKKNSIFGETLLSTHPDDWITKSIASKDSKNEGFQMNSHNLKSEKIWPVISDLSAFFLYLLELVTEWSDLNIGTFNGLDGWFYIRNERLLSILKHFISSSAHELDLRSLDLLAVGLVTGWFDFYGDTCVGFSYQFCPQICSRIW